MGEGGVYTAGGDDEDGESRDIENSGKGNDAESDDMGVPEEVESEFPDEAYEFGKPEVGE